MKSLDQALESLLADAARFAVSRSTKGSDRVALGQACGRVLAQDIASPIDVPAYHNSQMDGYAGVAVEMNNALEPMVVSQRIAAGHPGVALAQGTVARIFTGAPIPAGADAVAMQEHVHVLEDGRVRLRESVAPGQNIRPKAGDLHRGQIILKKGTRLSAADIALCASVGLSHLEVTRPLKVAVFSSGDELRQPGETLAFGQIFDSNRPMILALATMLGCEVHDMGCLPDNLNTTQERLQKAASQSDVILTCGGVSVGEEDHIKAAIIALGTLDLWKISIKPGKPFAHGRIGASVFMGMPGNPVAAWATFALLVRPYLLVASGANFSRPIGFRVPAGFDWPTPDSRQEYLRGWVDDRGVVQIHERQNSAVLSSVTQSQGLVEILPSTPIRTGEFVRFIPYTELLF